MKATVSIRSRITAAPAVKDWERMLFGASYVELVGMLDTLSAIIADVRAGLTAEVALRWCDLEDQRDHSGHRL